MKYKTIDQGAYWEIHDWERGFCVATAIPDQDMAEVMAEALNDKAELEKVKNLLKSAYEHLNYCGYGDSWERDCSEKLRKELDDYFSREVK